MQVEMEIHDILKGDEPPEDGSYLVFTHDPDDQIELHSMYWRSEKRAWSSSKKADNLLVPVEYWGRYWTPNFLTKVVSI